MMPPGTVIRAMTAAALVAALALAPMISSQVMIDSLRFDDRDSGLESYPEETVPVLEKMVDLGGKIREIPSNEMKQEHDEQKEGGESDTDGSSYLVLEKSLSNVTKDSGETVRMRCEVRGRPAPQHIRWFKNEAPLEPERGRVDVRRYSPGPGRVGSRLRIAHADIHDTGYYRCEASNDRHSVETTAILMVKAGRIHSPSLIPDFPPPFPHFPALGGRLPDFEQSDLGFCQQYRGVACSGLVGNKTVYLKASLTLNQMEEKLVGILTVLATGKEMNPECHKYAVPFLCSVLFPPCDDSVPYPVPRHVCRDDCDALQATTCRSEMALARRHPLLAGQDLLPDCEELPGHFPPARDGHAGSCISLNVPRVVQVDHEATCYEGRGEKYRGPVSHTASSHQCQSWSPAAEYAELSGGHNYCRNPGGLESQPWCFVSDPHIRREVCDIPRCADHDWLYICLPSLLAVVLVGVAICTWCRRRRRKGCSSKLSPHSTSAHLIPTHHQNSTHSSQQIEMQQKALPRVPLGVHEVAPQSLRFLHELGDGVFGKVFRGEMHHPRTLGGATVVSPVAIKTLREGASAQARQDFCREVERAASLQHPNVVSLVAVCVQGEPLCMLLEYAFRCDLHEYLLLHSPHSDAVEDGYVLELPDFLAIAVQVAAGMDYLSSKRYVHRDLAARNCLVSTEGLPASLSQSCLPDITAGPGQPLVKISDLGASRHSCAADYFRVRNALLPVRWMAPESLLYGAFTAESDAWSFGVLLWELFSYGTRPYLECCDGQEVVDRICGHQLLPRPDRCPPHLYSIMCDCWHDSPGHRPTFKEIFNRLCCSAQTLHERTYSLSHHSVLTHNSSSTGQPTLSTNLSCGTTGTGGGRVQFCGSGPTFVSAKAVAAHRTHQCEKV